MRAAFYIVVRKINGPCGPFVPVEEAAHGPRQDPVQLQQAVELGVPARVAVRPRVIYDV